MRPRPLRKADAAHAAPGIIDVARRAPKVAADLQAAENSKPVVEAVTAAADPALVPLEDAGYACLGEIAALLNAGGEAAASKLADAGLDVNVINIAKQALAQIPQIATVAKAL